MDVAQGRRGRGIGCLLEDVVLVVEGLFMMGGWMSNRGGLAGT